MAETTTLGTEHPWTVLELPLGSLAALGALPGLTCGALSPLARLEAPAEPPDASGLPALIARAQELSAWALPTLLDPQLTVGIMVGDPDEPALRQYAWPDAEGAGPGFEVVVRDDALTLEGGVDLPQLREELAALLALDELRNLPVFSLRLSAAEFWVLAALIDAYRMSLSARRHSRLGGRPQGVLVTDIIAAWELGRATHHPGWAVSMFALLAPNEVPRNFDETLRHTLEDLDDADLLMVLENELSAGVGATVVFGENLEQLVAGLAGQFLTFGLAVHRLQTAGEATVTTLGGWRTPDSLWLADLPGLVDGTVQLLLASGEFVGDLLDTVLGGEPDPQFTAPTPYGPEQLSAMLSTPALSPVLCRSCGEELQPGWRFCAKCKTPVETAGPGQA